MVSNRQIEDLVCASVRWQVAKLSAHKDKALPPYGCVYAGGNTVHEFQPPWENAPTCEDLNLKLVAWLRLPQLFFNH